MPSPARVSINPNVYERSQIVPICRAACRNFGSVGLAILLLLGCAPGKHPFLMVQMCLSNERGVTEFFDEMKSIAAANNMVFLDNSGDTIRELKATGYAGHERDGGSPAINFAVERKDGQGASAGNLSLPGYQVAVGFSEGSSPAEAQAFANVVVSRLEKHWKIHVVPRGTGAKPMPGCE